jgi:type IV pilus assembly protein PilP
MSGGIVNRRWSFSLSLIIVVAAVATVIAQTPATSTAPAATTGTAVTGTSVQQTLQEILEEPTGADTYRYDPQGRRDPFRSLVGPAPRIDQGVRPPGVPGFLIDEIKLTGIVRTKQGIVGVIAGPDNKGYLIRIGDKVLDGEVVRITPSSVVFRQEVNDPTRIERFREVVKDLTPPSEKR